MSTATPKPLTRHAPGSFRELTSIVLPLMLSALSGALMIFFDRLILGYYSTSVMNAVVATSTVFAAFQFGALSIAGIAEVFVGQHNGAGNHKKMKEPVWQMIWFSLMTIVIFWPVAYFGQEALVTAPYRSQGSPYFFWMMLFGPLFATGTALASFFIGQGRTMIVTCSIIIGMLINIVLDILLIFGVPGLLEPMAAKGAAIGSGIAQSSVVLILLGTFLAPKERLAFDTHHWHFNWSAFKQCLKIGVPSGMGHVIAIAAWAFIAHIAAVAGPQHMTLFSITQTVWITLSFTTEGLSKGVTATCSNHIGANQMAYVHSSLRMGCLIAVIGSLLMGIPFLIFPEFIALQFLNEVPASFPLESFVGVAVIAYRWMWVSYLMDGFIWSYAGLLTAAGDTRFQMLWMSFAAWFFCVLPMWYFLMHMQAPPIRILQVIAFFIACDVIAFYWRYRSNIWQKKAHLV